MYQLKEQTLNLERDFVLHNFGEDNKKIWTDLPLYLQETDLKIIQQNDDQIIVDYYKKTRIKIWKTIINNDFWVNFKLKTHPYKLIKYAIYWIIILSLETIGLLFLYFTIFYELIFLLIDFIELPLLLDSFFLIKTYRSLKNKNKNNIRTIIMRIYRAVKKLKKDILNEKYGYNIDSN